MGGWPRQTRGLAPPVRHISAVVRRARRLSNSSGVLMRVSLILQIRLHFHDAFCPLERGPLNAGAERALPLEKRQKRTINSQARSLASCESHSSARFSE